MVSMFSSHFFNWTEQLKESGHEIYWLDVFDSNTQVKKIDFVKQIIGWRFKWDFPGRYIIKHNSPLLNKAINVLNERKLEEVFEEKLKEIKPDVVHSFVMYSACVPILRIMKKYRKISWIYSAWGNDLFYYQNFEKQRNDMIRVFPRLDYMFADCRRDLNLAVKFGFKGKVLGAYPGGGGYNFSDYNLFLRERKQRDTILIKGYQHKFGRCNMILLAIAKDFQKLKEFNIVVFGANKEVIDFVNDSQALQQMKNLTVLEKIDHTQVLKLMGRSYIYIGNSISDGMPNTLLEAIVMETFPIQSNPGGATAEIIEDGENGLLINNAEDYDEISSLIKKALKNPKLVENAIIVNNKTIKPKLERNFIKNQVLGKYEMVYLGLNEKFNT